MTKKKKNRPSAVPTGQPGRSEKGREVRATELPPAEATENAGSAPPHGLPIPLKDYEALQANAKRFKPRDRGSAQEDPGQPADT